MRVLLVNTSERIGGAAVATNRLMDALNNNGVKCKMLVRDKLTDDITVATLPRSPLLKWNFLWERLRIFLSLSAPDRNREGMLSVSCLTAVNRAARRARI